VGISILSLGALGVLRFLYFYFSAGGQGHLQSLVLSGVLIIIGFILIMIGLVADIVSLNRRLIEDILYRVKKAELELFSKQSSREEINEEKSPQLERIA
jgi:hypothetical protein